MIKPTILVVEDDPSISKLISITLEMHDYLYRTAKTGNEAILEILSNKADIIILDLGLPDTDGIDIIRKVRSWSSIPIIVVSARGEDKDKIEALDEGADDYLTKPFSVDELLARLRVSLRRIQKDDELKIREESIFVNGRLEIDYLSHSVFIKEQEIHVTPIEYKLLCLLSKNSGRVLTYNFILKKVWGIHGNDASALRVFMATLRKKIEEKPSEPQIIQTHIGVGYRMVRVEERKE